MISLENGTGDREAHLSAALHCYRKVFVVRGRVAFAPQRIGRCGDHQKEDYIEKLHCPAKFVKNELKGRPGEDATQCQ